VSDEIRAVQRKTKMIINQGGIESTLPKANAMAESGFCIKKQINNAKQLSPSKVVKGLFSKGIRPVHADPSRYKPRSCEFMFTCIRI
jgi:hypothetical protein